MASLVGRRPEGSAQLFVYGCLDCDSDLLMDQLAQREGLKVLRSRRFLDTRAQSRVSPVAACRGGRLVVHFTNRKNAPLDFPHTIGDATEFERIDVTGIQGDGSLWLDENQLRRQSWHWCASKYEMPSKIVGDASRRKEDIAKAAEQLFILRDNFHRVPSMSAQEDYCAYRLMEASRALATGWSQKEALFVAKWCGGYLLVPLRIIVTMLGVIVGLGFIYSALALGWPGSLVDASQGSAVPIGSASVPKVFLDCLYFSAITFVTLSFGIVPVGTARAFAMIEAFLGLVLAALLTASLARRALRW